MARVRGLNAVQWAGVACGIVGVLAGLAGILLPNPIAALIAVALVGGYFYLMDRGKRRGGGPPEG